MTGTQHTGCVYFARVGDFVKIGYASNPHERVKSLLAKGNLILPDGIDAKVVPTLILVIPFCRMRDERNMQLLFSAHWVVGEWFRWSPLLESQMRNMRFVTHAVRRKHLAAVRRAHGGSAHAKEERWGMQTTELLAHIADWRRDYVRQEAA